MRIVGEGDHAARGAHAQVAILDVAVAESENKRSGGDAVLARLSELMFVEVLRQYVESLPDGQAGWLSGLRDPAIARALSQLHARPGHSWTLETLAEEVAVSRSVLAERFNQLVGMPAMQYLARWRMQVAAGQLTQGGAKIAEIALAMRNNMFRALPASMWVI